MVDPDNQGLALLYVRVSTALQVEEGVSLDVQERSLIQAAEVAGYTKYEVIREEGKSGKNLSGRPAISSALERLKNQKASALFVTRIDRLARSTRDFLAIVDQSQEFNWRLVLLDLNLDTSSYSSRFVVTIMSALAEMERGIIAERQKDVHKDRRSRGIVWGVDMGPMNKTPDDIRQRVVAERMSGASYRKIADGLNRDAISSQNGGAWYPTTVKNLLELVERLLHQDLKPDSESQE
jgi:site-specific DNA recombinase